MVHVDVLHLGPVGHFLRYLLDAVVGRLEAARVLDELLVLEDLLGQPLHQDRVERHVERLDRPLAADDRPLRDVPLQLRRQRRHLAARSHRRDRLLVLLTTHPPRSEPCTLAAVSFNGLLTTCCNLGDWRLMHRRYRQS